MPVQPLLSVTVTTIGNVPVCVGVPERTPVGDNVNPAGSVLAVENVAEPTAPLCVKVWLNAAPATLVLTDGFVTVMTGQTIVNA